MAARVQQPLRPTPWAPTQPDDVKTSSHVRMASGQCAESPPASSQAGYTLRMLTEADTPELLRFLRRFFFLDEPMNVAVQLLGPKGDEPCVPLEEYCMQSLSEPLSLAAVSPSGELLGVCLNGSTSLDETSPAGEGGDDKWSSCPHPRFRKILRLLCEIEAMGRARVVSKWPQARRLLEVRVLSVDGSSRGLGIGTALLRKTRELALEHGFPLVRCDCSSAFSARAVAKLGFEPICEIAYSSYLGDDGKPVFEPEPPHTKIISYVYEL